MKAALASLLGRIRGAGANGENDIVQRACLESAARAPATDAAPIAVSYSIGVKEIGDRVSPIAVQYATGRAAVWRRPSTGAHLLAAGGILHWARSNRMSGDRPGPGPPIGEIEGERIWALRGKLTHDLLRPEINGLRDVPLGDPLYLVGRRVAALAPSRSPTHRLGIVPGSPIAPIQPLRICAARKMCWCWYARAGARVFARMMACEAIASSSLSALILAEALGIPNLWLDFGAEDAERAFDSRTGSRSPTSRSPHRCALSQRRRRAIWSPCRHCTT